MKKYENFCKALANLQVGLELEEPFSIVEQTGIVGLFEICFEQSWKLMKELLEEHGRFENKIGSPRAIIKIAYQCDMIGDEELWLDLLEARNVLAHTYSDDQALSVIRELKSDYVRAFEELKNEVEERWIEEA
ncbi:MAG: nucleotidyltransferase substrate binding protein [Lachnospiraceae bacterium]|nr:nucleotidyltransferase substrate binding protein [Lachnospiraceae bacterium]